MLEILQEAEKKKKIRGGKLNSLPMEKKAINGFGILKKVSRILPCSFFIRNIRK